MPGAGPGPFGALGRPGRLLGRRVGRRRRLRAGAVRGRAQSSVLVATTTGGHHGHTTGGHERAATGGEQA